MSESPADVPPSQRGRVETAITLARLEAKLDVALAQHGAKLIEVERRVAITEATDVKHNERLNELEQYKAAAEARELSEQTSRRNGLSRGQLIGVWAALVVSALIGIGGILVTIGQHP